LKTPFRYFFLGLISLLVACDKPVLLSPDAQLPNGAIYQGDIQSGKFHGSGKLVYPVGAYYEGEFKEGLFHGQGSYVYPAGERYDGQFENGVYQGQGIFVDSAENVYEGYFVNGRYHGQGTHKLKSGPLYEGEFKNGKYHGQGKYTQGEYEYSGDFVDGVLSGRGRYKAYDGSVYQGEIENWVASGQGVKTKEDGSVITGAFVNGYAEGDGKIVSADGSVYVGAISYGVAEGEGSITYADKSIYQGEFSYGRRQGIGTLTTPASGDSPETVVSGKWRADKLVHDFSSGQIEHSQAEIALQNHQRLLSRAHAGLAEQSDDKTDVYFLGVAGDGSQSVFKREIEFIQPLIEERYASRGKTISLINHHDTAAQYPMATSLSISSSIKAIGNVMDKQNDILFIYLTSHGSKKHNFHLNHDSISLPGLSADTLGDMLEVSKIKWKIIVVSACYSGGFISALENETTMVITAADATSTSFGCSEESEMTYFGKAFFKETLSKDADISLVDAFEKAKDLVSEWENEEDISESRPQIFAPKLIVDKLRSLNNESKKTVKSDVSLDDSNDGY